MIAFRPGDFVNDQVVIYSLSPEVRILRADQVSSLTQLKNAVDARSETRRVIFRLWRTMYTLWNR